MYHTIAIRDQWVEMKLGGFRRRDWRRIGRICDLLNERPHQNQLVQEWDLLCMELVGGRFHSIMSLEDFGGCCFHEPLPFDLGHRGLGRHFCYSIKSTYIILIDPVELLVQVASLALCLLQHVLKLDPFGGVLHLRLVVRRCHLLHFQHFKNVIEPLLVSGRTPTAILQPPPGRNVARRAAPQLVQHQLLRVHLLHLELLPKLDGR